MLLIFSEWRAPFPLPLPLSPLSLADCSACCILSTTLEAIQAKLQLQSQTKSDLSISFMAPVKLSGLLSMICFINMLPILLPETIGTTATFWSLALFYAQCGIQVVISPT